jgi:hypothetical protein
MLALLPDKKMTAHSLLLALCSVSVSCRLCLPSKRAWHRRRRATAGDLLIIMSATEIEGEAEAVRAAENVCGWCGIAAVDNIKLEDCGGCDLVKYCGDKCRGEHRHWHAGDCKRRAKELHDRKLFTHPDSCCRGECPICFLPMPLEGRKSTFFSCCSKKICKGCHYAHYISNKHPNNCPFCRGRRPDDEEYRRGMMKRIEAGDPAAMTQMGIERYKEGDYDGAFEYLTTAAELGDMKAHNQLGLMYVRGWGVEMDEGKAVYYWEKAPLVVIPTLDAILRL